MVTFATNLRHRGPRVNVPDGSGKVQAAIFAAEVEQWVAARFKARFFYATDQDEVVASLMQCMAFAFEYTQRAWQDRRTIFADFPTRSGKAILGFPCEQVGNGLLPNLQNVDGEVVNAAQNLCAAGIIGDAH
jgi:hypothetical protein